MKIVIIIPTFIPEFIGGTQIMTLGMAEELASRGHDVYIITASYSDKTTISNIKGIQIIKEKVDLNFPASINPIFLMRLLIRINRIQPDVIHVQGVLYGFNLIAILIKKLIRAPLLICPQGLDINDEYPLKNIILKLTFDNSDAIISLTDDMKIKIREYTGKEIKIIPNGINPNRIKKYSKEQARYELKLKNKSNILLFVGRLEPEKSIDSLIYSFKDIHQIHPDSELLIVGSGSKYSELLKMVNEFKLNNFIKFYGKIDNEDVPKFMSASDIFLLPSLTEGMPISIIEAITIGLPVIATRVGGISEAIIDRRNGLLVDVGDIDGITSRILELIGDKELRIAIKNNNIHDSKKFDLKHIISKYENIYLSMRVSTRNR